MITTRTEEKTILIYGPAGQLEVAVSGSIEKVLVPGALSVIHIHCTAAQWITRW